MFKHRPTVEDIPPAPTSTLIECIKAWSAVRHGSHTAEQLEAMAAEMADRLTIVDICSYVLGLNAGFEVIVCSSPQLMAAVRQHHPTAANLLERAISARERVQQAARSGQPRCHMGIIPARRLSPAT